MTLETLFLLVVPVYLVLLAYGQVGSRRRGLTPRMRAVAGALRVIVPPVAIGAALLATGNHALVATWGGVTFAMLVAGIVVAGLVEVIAPRVGA